MTLTEDMIRLMSNPTFEQISFSLGDRFVVRGADMAQVATQLRRGTWTVITDTTVNVAYCDAPMRRIGLTQPVIATTKQVYEAVHEGAHAMLILTGLDRPQMGVVVEVAATLLPIIYLYITQPFGAQTGTFFAEHPSAQFFVNVVRQLRMYEASTQVPPGELNLMMRYVMAEQREQEQAAAASSGVCP